MQNFQKIVAVFALSLFALGSTQGMAQNRNARAVVPPPTSTQASPTNTRTFIVCASPCRDLSTARIFNTRVGAVPQGNFQITGLTQGQYSVGSEGFAPRQYPISRNGILNGVLGMHRSLLSPVISNPPSNTDLTFCYMNARGCYKDLKDCDGKCIMVAF